jgi:hypothetical protein
MDEAEREDAGSLEPLAIGGSEVSTLPLSLHECDIDDFAKIVARLLLGEIRLKALIAASDRAYYFLPITEFKQDSEVTELFEKGIYAKTPSDSDKMNEYRAESGTYEILDIESVARNLDEIFAQRLSVEEVWIEFKLSLSPKGILGLLVELVAGHGRTVIIHSPSIYCNRILIEEVLADKPLQTGQPSSGSRQSDLDYLIGLYLDETDNAGGIAGFKRFMIERYTAEILPADRISWPIPGEEPKKLAIATIKNKLSKIKGRRKV